MPLRRRGERALRLLGIDEGGIGLAASLSLVGLTASLVLVFGLLVGGPAAQNVNFGLGVAKGCQTVTAVGGPIKCAGFIQNQDRQSNTYTLLRLGDPTPPPPNHTDTLILMQDSPEFTPDVPSVGLIFFSAANGGGAVTCSPGDTTSPGPDSGTPVNPWTGATSCTLPGDGLATSGLNIHNSGAGVETVLFNHGTATHTDLLNGTANDQFFGNVRNTCNKTPGAGCDSNTLNEGNFSASTTVVDANVSITPNKTNEVGNQHQFTIKVEATTNGVTTPGQPNGVPIFNITPSVDPTPNAQQTSDCATPTITGLPTDPNHGVVTATCTLTINNSQVGLFTANADAVVTIGNPPDAGT